MNSSLKQAWTLGSKMFFNQSITHKDSVLFPVAGLQNALKMDNEQVIKLGYQYNF